ncbi:hypothetical protein ACFLX5_01945 [Chloroflexota bacterium]
MNGTQSVDEAIAEKYRPLLVLYPEISDGSRRIDHKVKDWRAQKLPHIDQDYYPRDIRLVLDSVWLPGEKQKPSSENVLDAMSKNEVNHIRITRHGIKDVDKYWEYYSSLEEKDSNEQFLRRAYARIVRGKGRYQPYLSIQYWLPYFYDDWANVHQMDWEMASVILKTTENGEKPYACVFNAHHGGHREYWINVHMVNDEKQMCPDGLHPVVYVANGSHASYFSDHPPARHTIEDTLSGGLREAVRKTRIGSELLTDHIPSFEKEDKYFPEISVIPEPDDNGQWSGEWRWLNFKGNWGTPPATNKIIGWAKALGHLIKVYLSASGLL